MGKTHMKTTVNRGSAHAVIIIVLVVALLGTLGFVFWQNFIKKDDTAKTTDTTKQTNDNKTAESTTKKAETKTDTPAQPSDVKYLVVKEWGVKFPYKGKDTLTYEYLDDAIQLISKKLADKYKGSCEEGFMFIGRDKEGDEVSQWYGKKADYLRTYKQLYDSPDPDWAAGKAGGYYYVPVHFHNRCGPNMEKVGEFPDSAKDQKSAHDMVHDAVRGVQLIEK